MRGRVDQHARYRELIAGRLEKPLSRVELRQLNSHLKTCPSCQALESEYRAERGLLRALPTPMPPRDLWARTSASLDREVSRAYRSEQWRRRMSRGRRSAQPSTAMLTAVAAIGVSAAIAVLQLAPAIGPAASVQARPTPLTVPRQELTYIGVGVSDVAVYRAELSQVCPASAIDCVQSEKFVRTPLQLPADMRAGNISLSPSGKQLALVGHVSEGDVIAVVMMPPDPGDSTGGDSGSSGPIGGKSADRLKSSDPNATSDSGNNSSVGGAKTHTPDPNSIQDPEPASTPATNPGGNNGNGGNSSSNTQPTGVPGSGAPALAVLNILENVRSAGAAPDWSPNGTMLAFSAMPDDGSAGPDVYIWSPGDATAQAITDDHSSYFASWSGNRIVISRLTGGQHPHTFVFDPKTSEQRAVGGPQLWLPAVNTQRTQAIGWFGQLDTSGKLPTPRSGALYLEDWSSIDPFGAAAPGPTPSPTESPAATPRPTDPPTPSPTATPRPTDPPATDPPATDPPATDEPTTDKSPAPEKSASANQSGSPEPTPSTAGTRGRDLSEELVNSNAADQPSAKPSSDNADVATPQPPAAATSAPATTSPQPTPTADNSATANPLDSLIPLEPDRDPRAAPVVDWQAHWSADGEVLGVWIADSTDSSWGRLAVLAVDQNTSQVSIDDPLLSMTLARRGFSVGENRVAWVGPSEDNVDGELRIRTWGPDGVGGLRLKGPDQEEVTPAS